MADNTYSAPPFTDEDLQNLLSINDFIFDMSSSSAASSQQGSSPSQSSAPGFSCNTPACGCGRTFRRRSDLKKHEDRCTRPYACLHVAECGVRSFTNKHDRDRHRLEIHGEPSANGTATRRLTVKLPCPVTTCKRHFKGFGRKENLVSHVRNMHPEGTMAEAALAERREAATPAPAVARPARMSPLPTSPAPTSASGSSFVATDATLLTGLQGWLWTSQSWRDALAAELAEVDEQIHVVTQTVAVLQWPTGAFEDGLGWGFEDMDIETGMGKGMDLGAEGLTF